MVGTVPLSPEGRALEREPIRLDLGGSAPGGRWLAIGYAANLYADPVRPVIRFARPGGVEEALMPGPALGRGSWLGLVPRDAASVEIDPGATPFRIESVEVLTGAALLARCLARRPGRFVTALSFLARGNTRRFRDTLRGALATTPLTAWAAYAAPRRRALDPALDRPLAEGGALAVLVVVSGRDPAATVASLAAQTHRSWRAALVGAESSAPSDPRVGRLDWPEGALAASVLGPMLEPAPAALAFLEAGDVLAPEALALLCDRLAARPDIRLVYADEEGPEGPRLKPGWDPDFALVADATGRPALHAGSEAMARMRASTARSPAALEADLALDAALGQAPVHHLARLLVRRAGAALRPDSEEHGRRLAAALTRTGLAASVTLDRGVVDLAWPLPEPPPLVTAVIPSRDRLDLLEPCLAGLLGATDYPAVEVVIVDNDSRDPAVLRYYEGLAAEPRVRILSWPGAFDFASMVNEGAEAARGRVLLLLNNDTAVLHPDWLGEMVRQAVRPEVGAVGARLLYANGTLQHAGVVVGLGGRAGHVLRRRPAVSPGHLGRMRVAHEVSAVTAACLAVERAKYRAVGGLDAEAFPIDFNDVDLCLRLAGQGWKTIWTPRATLSHLESISRGPAVGLARARFEAESARFAARWEAVIRNDPFYHPALSATTFGEDLE